jgi:hypothetical protein
MHIRRRWLNAIKAQLKTISDFSKRVLNQRTAPKTGFPGVTVYAVTETTAIETIHLPPRSQERTLTVHVNLYIKTTQDDEKLESDIDSYTALIEAVIKAPEGVNDLQLIETIFPEVFPDDEKLDVAEITMIYLLRYDTTEFNPL